MIEEIKKIKDEVLLKLGKIKNSQALKDLEVEYLGRKGRLTGFLKNISSLSVEEKKTIGKLANEVKNELKEKVLEIKNVINGKKKSGSAVDVTVPGKKIARGHLHPLTQVQYELEEMFVSLGFMVLDGPELESDFFNFEALNIPSYHPARDMQDTFYIDVGKEGDKEGVQEKSDLVMRTQTSPMQVRAMREYGAPLRCVIPGRVFRNEDLDDCHDTTFDQIEGLMVGEDISLANLISVLKEMMSGIFKREVEIRVRPGYFPFVEPGIEVDAKCTICGGKGCSTCKHTGWLEMIGAGMVHPNVLKAGGIDPDKFSGFAFGLGTTRLVMMKYGIEDIRVFNGGDMRFLEQF